MSWAQLTEDITFYAFFVASKQGKTGLSTTVDIYEDTAAGSATAIVSGGSATEVGGGIYKYRLTGANVDAEGCYVAVFKTADATVDQQWIPALWIVGKAGVENLDAAISTRNATTPPTAAANATAVRSELATELARVDVAVSSVPGDVWEEATTDHDALGSTGAALAAAGGAADPLAVIAGSYASDTMGGKIQLIGTNTTVVLSPIVNANIEVIYGDDYYIADGRAVPLTSTQWVIADITPYTGVIKVTTPTAVLSFPVTITAAKQAYLPLTAAQIATIGIGYHTYDFEVTKIADSHVATLQQGSFAVMPDAR